MKISYDWLIQYLDTDIPIKDLCEMLTDSGLEVESYQEINNLLIERIVLGEIRDFHTHPYSVKFNILQVDIGKENTIQIICGETNISKGKKVIIAPVGVDILDNTGKKKQLEIINIYGINSYGLICSYRNIGLQNNNILYIYNDKLPGSYIKEVFKIRKDYSLEIEITTNRIDALSHWGIARELYAILKKRRNAAMLHKPSFSHVNFQSKNLKNLLISINETDKCKRYSGCFISGVKIAPSPIWLQNRLRSIGLHPNNNVDDIINFVMHEFSHPLNVLDVEDINGKEIYIKTIQENRNARLLLNYKDLIICDAKKTIGLAGIFGSNIKRTANDIFLESAYFEPVNIRKSIKKHDIITYSSYFFERGVDYEQIVYVLKRAAFLIKEISGGNIYATTDFYPKQIAHVKTIIRYKKIHSLLGKKLSKQSIKKILFLLEIDLLIEKNKTLNVSVPSYRVDVCREVDLIEDFLRIYGYNHIKIPKTFYYFTNIEQKKTFQSVENDTSSLLNAQGFYEVVNPSLTKIEYTKFLDPTALYTIKLLNPLNKEIAVLRESLLFGLLERISYNIKRKNLKLKIFEWGNFYEKIEKTYNEKYCLGLMISGKEYRDHWLYKTGMFSFFYIKGIIEGIMTKFGIRNPQQKIKEDCLLEHALWIYYNNNPIIRMGRIKNKVIEIFDIRQDVFFAEIYCKFFFKFVQDFSRLFEPISQLPGARRDLAILLDKRISFEEIYQKIKALRVEMIKEIQLFDVYEMNNLQRKNKSYALSFYLENRNKNLTESEIVKTIENIQNTLSKKLGVKLRI